MHHLYGCIGIRKIHKNLIIISGDTSTSAGLERFKNNFPDKYLEVGIAEQNMMGIAAGCLVKGIGSLLQLSLHSRQ